MQIEFFFNCRECGADSRILWDTARELAELVVLECSSSRCSHVSGELFPAYIYREEHQPSWEREGGEGIDLPETKISAKGKPDDPFFTGQLATTSACKAPYDYQAIAKWEHANVAKIEYNFTGGLEGVQVIHTDPKDHWDEALVENTGVIGVGVQVDFFDKKGVKLGDFNVQLTVCLTRKPKTPEWPDSLLQSL